MKRTFYPLIAFVIALFIYSSGVYSQTVSFTQYKDTVNHFTIGVPPGWWAGVNKNYPNLQMVGYRVRKDTSEHKIENWNLNILKKSNSSREREYRKLIDALQSTGDFHLVSQDTVNINGSTYNWFIEEHVNLYNHEPEINYVFMTYKDGKTYILTFVAFKDVFPKYKPLFLQIAQTFSL